MFSKEERSTFKYWFAHWCAFQMTSLNHKMWKPKYLLHDIEKPWLKLFWNYPKVQKWHRTHNSHHIEYYFIHHKADWKAMVIDWECSRFTKTSSPLTARQEMVRQIMKYPDRQKLYNMYIIPILDKYNFE